jgi:deoxyxylulose-5-phosphate synthase
VEDNALSGGFGQAVNSYLTSCGLKAKISCIGYSDEFLDDFSVEHSLESAGITANGILSAIKNLK